MPKRYQLDEIDREIIWALDDNARLSATKISQLIGVSKQRVAFRIRRMTNLGILDLFSAIIDKTKLGYFHCQIYLKFKKVPSEEIIFNKLKKIPSLHWEGITSGNYNLVIFFLVKSLEECWQVYQKIIGQFSNEIIKKEILLTSKTYFLNHSYITGAPKRISVSEFPHRAIKLKQRDLSLINAIKEHGRIKINELAKKINITPYTIRQRIAYLRKKGVITAFRIRINHAVLGFKHYMISLNLPGMLDSQKEQLIQSFIKEKETIRLTETVGKWDLICDLILSPDKSPKEWLKNFLTREQFSKSRISTNILEVKKVLPINTVTYS
jgi:DNA-binding Lrp family transcriptional regulator